MPSVSLSTSADDISKNSLSTAMEDVNIELENKELWKKFDEHTTEMIVTKGGRRMFPTLRYRLTGLNPNATYAVFLEMTNASGFRFKFQTGRWMPTGNAEPVENPLTDGTVHSYAHPDSPAPGRVWMRQSLSFHRIKLTNNPMDISGHVQLSSMSRYEPRLVIVRLHDYFGPSIPKMVASASFPETAFVAVTAYQNEKIIQLKINHNPFAKGFRDSGGSQRKRSISRSSCETTSTTSDEKRCTGDGEEEESKSKKRMDQSVTSDRCHSLLYPKSAPVINEMVSQEGGPFRAPWLPSPIPQFNFSAPFGIFPTALLPGVAAIPAAVPTTGLMEHHLMSRILWERAQSRQLDLMAARWLCALPSPVPSSLFSAQSSIDKFR